MNNLVIQNLSASIEDKNILNGVALTVKPGEVHAIMGPNGSGKSTLAQVLLGNPAYKILNPNDKFQIKIGAKKLNDIPTEERASAGLFLAFQTPVAIPGVSVVNLLRTAYMETHPIKEKKIQNPALSNSLIDFSEFTKTIKKYAKVLSISDEFLRRGLGDGFSGGEKKKMEMLQALVLSPKFAIFDEIDTGLDVDALKTVASGIKLLKKQGTGVIIITHYQRILSYIKPDVVHIFVSGKIVETGNSKLAGKIEKEGYKKYDGKTH